MQSMDGHNTSTEEMLQTLLVRTAVMQTQQEATLASLKLLQDGQKALVAELAALRAGQAELLGAVCVTQAEIKALNEKMTYYVTEAKVESVLTELHKSIEAQTWRLLIWMTGVCSGTAAAAYYIARNVY